MSITVKKFVEDFQNKKIVNSKVAPDAIEKYIKSTLEVKEYIPFRTKSEIVKTIVDNNIEIVDGYKKVNSVTQFLGFITAMIVAHTNLEFEEPYEDYDLLCESGLLDAIISCFKEDYGAFDVLLKLAIADEMQDNDIAAIVSQFLSDLTERIGNFGDTLNRKLESLNLNELLKENINEENLTNILSLFNK